MTTQAEHPADYARGVLQVEADTLRRERDRAIDALAYLAAAVRGGQEWDITIALDTAQTLINHHGRKP